MGALPGPGGKSGRGRVDSRICLPLVHVEELQMNPETARFGGHDDECRALSLARLCPLAAGYAGPLRHRMRG